MSDVMSDVMPDSVSERRLIRGIVGTDASELVLRAVGETLDKLEEGVLKSVVAQWNVGPLSPDFAVAKWYEWLAVHNLRRELARKPRDPALNRRA